MQRIGIEMNQDAQYEIAERALTRFKRSLFTDEIAGGVNDAFFRALEEWPNAIGWNMRDADHDDARFFIELLRRSTRSSALPYRLPGAPSSSRTGQSASTSARRFTPVSRQRWDSSG